MEKVKILLGRTSWEKIKVLLEGDKSEKSALADYQVQEWKRDAWVGLTILLSGEGQVGKQDTYPFIVPIEI